MASRYLITVGGTGQHIALAVARLVRAHALVGDIQLIALDPDNATPLPQLLKAPTPSMSGANHPLKNGTVRAPFDIEKLGKKTFEELFVDADHPMEQELFQALFDEDEGKIPVHKGMYGTPCVGATVFGEGANTDALQNLLKPLATATQVFVCGSVVGGTGAGLMHKLVREIQRYYAGEMFGIFMLPWFDIDGGGGAAAINMAVINRNASHGTKYFYEHTLPMLTASLLVGSPGMRATPVLQRIKVGEGDMAEKPSYLHLVAARAMLDLPKAHTANREVKAYGMVHSLTREGWLLDETWETGRSLRHLVRSLRVQENLLRFLTEKKNREKILSYYEGGFWKSPDAWKPLDASIVANAPDKKQRRALAERALERFDEIRQEVHFCVDWAQRLFPGSLLDVENDVLMRDLSDSAKKGTESEVHWRVLREMWMGSELPANPTKPNGGTEVANHHAEAILDHAKQVS
jgi:hypothetical protein